MPERTMLSLTTTNARIPNSHSHTSSRLSNGPLIRSVNLESNPEKRGENCRRTAVVLNQCFGSKGPRRDRHLDNTSRCWCGPSGGEGEDVELDAEIMDFMAKSEKPEMFPTKKELIEAGRKDLVEAIKNRDGWFSLGWEEDESVGDRDKIDDNTIGESQRRVEGCKERASLRTHSFTGDEDKDRFSSEISRNLNSLHLPALVSSAGSLEIGGDEASGIEGILSRLEKQRNTDFGLNLSKEDRHFDNNSLCIDGIDLEENGRLTPNFNQNGALTSGGNCSQHKEPETWRTWSNQRAGSKHTEFEAAEIPFSKDRSETDKESYHDEVFLRTEEYADALKYEQTNHNQIRTRLQHLECEINTVLHSMRSNREEIISDEAHSSVIGSDLRKLSDACEFQENEFMSAKERLRSIRAKLAVLEGKMALAIIDAQKIMEMKQNQIDGASKALYLLRTTCIVWHDSASEVLLVGSFDGWTSQRKMDKSRKGFFSLSLQLYPGRYEMKFLVDGVWKVDPLQPIVHNNGYENNLFIV